MKKALVIHNPKSGTFNAKKIRNKIKEQLTSVFILDYQLTDSFQHLLNLLAPENLALFDLVIGIGGDGTINAVAAAASKNKLTLGIVPTGSGNGFANTLGIKNIDHAINVIKKQHFMAVDALQINKQLSFNVSGVGFDAAVAKSFSKQQKRGFFKYLKIILAEFRFKSYNIAIETEKEQLQGDFLFISIANSNQWGNNIIINPNSSLSDGVFEIIGLKKIAWYKIPKLFMYLMLKKLPKHPQIVHLSCSEVMLTPKTANCPMHIDGDYVGTLENAIKIVILPQVLKVFCPE